MVQSLFRGNLTWNFVLKSFHMCWTIYAMIWICRRKHKTHSQTSTLVTQATFSWSFLSMDPIASRFCCPFLKTFYLFSFHGSLYRIPFKNEFIKSEFPTSKIASCSPVALLKLLGDRASAFNFHNSWCQRARVALQSLIIPLLWIRSAGYHVGCLKRKLSRQFWIYSTTNTLNIAVMPFVIGWRKKYMQRQSRSPDTPKNQGQLSTFCILLMSAIIVEDFRPFPNRD